MNSVNKIAFQKAIKQSYKPQYQSIIFGALKRLHQCPQQANWDDLVQEARIVLASKLMVIGNNDKQRNPYLYQYVYWRLLDLLRSQQRRLTRQVNQDEDNQIILPIDDHMSEVYERRENDQLFKQLKPILTSRQKAYLDLLLQGYSDQEIALAWHCSRQALNNLRRRVIAKGRRLFKQHN